MITAAQAYAAIHAPGFNLKQLLRMPISENFTWAEVFTNRTLKEVKAAPKAIFNNAVRQAQLMELIRAEIRASLNKNAVCKVTSWYRTPAANRKNMGSPTSRHLFAEATDFFVPGFEGRAGNQKVQAVLMRVMHKLGFWLEVTDGAWTHADRRPGRTDYFAFTSFDHVLTAAEEITFIKANL